MRRGELDLDSQISKRYMVRVLAARFKVTERTVWRDLKALQEGSKCCPLCGAPRSPKE